MAYTGTYWDENPDAVNGMIKSFQKIAEHFGTIVRHGSVIAENMAEAIKDRYFESGLRVRTNALRGGVYPIHEPTGDGFIAGCGVIAHYGKYQELGTKYLRATHFMSKPMYDSAIEQIEEWFDELGWD